jgi:hypothetical protein
MEYAGIKATVKEVSFYDGGDQMFGECLGNMQRALPRLRFVIIRVTFRGL